MTEEDNQESLAAEWYERKSEMMVDVLGAEHDSVMHAMISFAAGGSLDFWYYPNGIAGTGIATKELSDLPGEGPANKVFDNYEFVMFTEEPVNLDDVRNEATGFGQAHRIIGAMLNCLAVYSQQATLNPRETCEFPGDMERIGGRCLIFDAYGHDGGHAEFGLMVVIEIHRSEMEYARENGGASLIAKLKDSGYYPYSGIERPAVV